MLGWGVVKEISLRSHLNNKAAVPSSPVPPLLLVWVWGLGGIMWYTQAVLAQGFLRREHRIAKVRESRGAGFHESDCLGPNSDSATIVRSGLGQDINRLNLRRLLKIMVSHGVSYQCMGMDQS